MFHRVIFFEQSIDNTSRQIHSPVRLFANYTTPSKNLTSQLRYFDVIKNSFIDLTLVRSSRVNLE